jgi:hypothetical protein
LIELVWFSKQHWICLSEQDINLVHMCQSSGKELNITKPMTLIKDDIAYCFKIELRYIYSFANKYLI